MNNNEHSQPKSQSSSNPPKKLRIEKIHGGENVEEVETVELMNEPDCKHDNMVRDYSETDFIAFMCENPKCGIVKLYNK